MHSDSIPGLGGTGGPPSGPGGPPVPKSEPGLTDAPEAMTATTTTANKANDASKDTDMADTPTRLLDQEPGQIVSSSPPFPRYLAYNEAATGTTGDSRQAQAHSVPTKTNAQESGWPLSLPMRPAAQKKVYPSYYTGTRDTAKAETGTTPNQDWMNSKAGQVFLKKHNMRVLPTQLLSLECQKRRFNPSFEVKQLGGEEFCCTVTIQDVTVTRTGNYGSGIAAKMDAALKALEVIRQWPVPAPSQYFLAEFQGEIPEDAVHQKLQDVLRGRRYTLHIHRNLSRGARGEYRGHLLLHLPAGETYTGKIVQLNRDHRCGLRGLVFDRIRTSTSCHLCGHTASHTTVSCPGWQKSSQFAIAPNRPGDFGRSFPYGLASAERIENAPSYKRDTDIVVNNPLDTSDQLLRTIQDMMGPGVAAGSSDDPRVKAALLQGFALGARFAATAPGAAESRERQRSRSPGRGEHRASDNRAPGAYRSRSPVRAIEALRYDNGSRGRDSRERTIDRGLQPRPAGPPRAYGGQDASYRDNGRDYR